MARKNVNSKMIGRKINSSITKCGKIKKKKFTIDIVRKENYMAERTQKERDNAIGSTVCHEARKPVNF